MRSGTTRLRKVTITLPDELVTYADWRAEQVGLNRSQVIGQALASLMTMEQQKMAVEGYQFYAAEAEEFATLTNLAAAEALLPADGWSNAQ